MAESMIERVAKAISRSQVETERMWQSFLPEASAAIEAMREPTEKMQQVVAAQWGRRTWAQYEEVIDAALKEQP